MNHLTALTNATIITPIREITAGTVLIEEGIIKDFGPADQVPLPAGTSIFDLKGAYVSPGFIDLHLHGAWGGDVMSGAAAGLKKMASGLIRGGVTAFLPSTLSGPWNEIINTVDNVEQAIKSGAPGARIFWIAIHVLPGYQPRQNYPVV